MSPKQDRQKRDIHEIFIGQSPLRLLKFQKNSSIPTGIFFRKFKNPVPSEVANLSRPSKKFYLQKGLTDY